MECKALCEHTKGCNIFQFHKRGACVLHNYKKNPMFSYDLAEKSFVTGAVTEEALAWFDRVHKWVYDQCTEPHVTIRQEGPLSAKSIRWVPADDARECHDRCRALNFESEWLCE